MVNLFSITLLIFFISSCKQEKTSETNQQKEKVTTNQNINSDTIKTRVDSNLLQNSNPIDTIKEISFKEFANEYIKNVKISKKYFLENSEGSILKTGYDFVKGYLDHSKVKFFSKSSLRLNYDDEYEADLKFKKDKNGNWKAFMIDTFGE